MTGKLCIRDAEVRDEGFFYDLHREGVGGGYFLNRSIATLREHACWFSNALRVDTNHMFVLGNPEERMGAIRFSMIEEDLWSVSVSVLKKYQGVGLGKKLIRDGMRELYEKMGGRVSVEAVVLESNHVSVSAFQSVGFTVHLIQGGITIMRRV